MVARRTSTAAPAKAESTLVRLFHENGYLRVPNASRRKTESSSYKKGYEIRWVTDTKRDLVLIRQLLRRTRLKAGKPFRKHEQWVQPVYGREATELFHTWLERFGSRSRSSATRAGAGT